MRWAPCPTRLHAPGVRKLRCQSHTAWPTRLTTGRLDARVAAKGGPALLRSALGLTCAMLALGSSSGKRAVTLLGANSPSFLASPFAANPTSQADAYERDKPGWQASEQVELETHRSNQSWEMIDCNEMPRCM